MKINYFSCRFALQEIFFEYFSKIANEYLGEKTSISEENGDFEKYIKIYSKND